MSSVGWALPLKPKYSGQDLTGSAQRQIPSEGNPPAVLAPLRVFLGVLGVLAVRQKFVRHQKNVNNQRNEMMLKVLNVSGKEMLEQLKLSCHIPGLLDAIATRQIIFDAAISAGIKVEVQELQQSADSLRTANNLLKAEDTWAWLQKHHLSLEEFEQLAEINLLSAKLANHLFADKVESFFYEHQLDYLAAVTYEVILEDEDLAWELFYALTEGEMSFQDMTRQHIQNPELRRTGGYRGIRPRKDFKPDIAAAVFAANPPELLKPIVTTQGVHLLRVEEIIRPELDQLLRLKIMSDFFSTWLKEQMAQIEVIPHFESDSYSPPVQELLKLA